jgi:hypothetical protein
MIEEITRCGNCGREIHQDCKKCPHCGGKKFYEINIAESLTLSEGLQGLRERQSSNGVNFDLFRNNYSDPPKEIEEQDIVKIFLNHIKLKYINIDNDKQDSPKDVIVELENKSKKYFQVTKTLGQDFWKKLNTENNVSGTYGNNNFFDIIKSTLVAKKNKSDSEIILLIYSPLNIPKEIIDYAQNNLKAELFNSGFKEIWVVSSVGANQINIDI